MKRLLIYKTGFGRTISSRFFNGKHLFWEVIMQKFQPTRIERGGTSLKIRWKDSHHGELSYRLLRQKCPCARCDATRSGKDPFHILPSDDFFENLSLVDVQRVGRYAVRLVWNDGHRTGIYTFQFLRELSDAHA